MNYRRLGKSGLKVSELSYGSWVTFSLQLDQSKSTQIMKEAYDKGVNFFDNAEVYANGQSEIIMGNAIKDLGWRRDTFIVSSKVFWGGEKPTQRGLSHKHIIDACHAAMKRLQVDYLDLYFCHRPDPETPIEETVRAMHTLVNQGKICYWGTSEWTAEQIIKAYEIANTLNLTPPTMEQPQYNLLDRDRFENEYGPLYEKYGLGTTIWSPLASGALTGKYLDGIPDGSRASLSGYEWLKKSMVESDRGQQRMERIKAITPIAEKLNVSMSKLAIAWCLLNKNVSTVILGASKLTQLEENLKSSEVVGLLDEDIQKELLSI